MFILYSSYLFFYWMLHFLGAFCSVLRKIFNFAIKVGFNGTVGRALDVMDLKPQIAWISWTPQVPVHLIVSKLKLESTAESLNHCTDVSALQKNLLVLCQSKQHAKHCKVKEDRKSLSFSSIPWTYFLVSSDAGRPFRRAPVPPGRLLHLHPAISHRGRFVQYQWTGNKPPPREKSPRE